MKKELSLTLKLKVNPFHIDCYGHLNNSFIPQYFEKGRIALQEKLNISDEELFENGIGLFVHKATYDYLNQAYPNNKLTLTSCLLPISKGPRIYIKHRLTSKNKTIANALTEHIFYSFKKKRPIKPRKELADLIK